MIEINIRADIEATLASMAQIPQALQDRALKDALSRTATQTKTVVVRAITREYVIRRDKVNPVIDVRRRFNDARRLSVEIGPFPSRSGRRAANVVAFLEQFVTLAKQRKRNRAGDRALHFKFRRGGGDKTIPGAFLANNGRTVFQRTGRGRLPIKPVMVIDVPAMFNAKRINEQGIAFIKQKFPELIKAEVAQEVRRFQR